MGNILFRRKKIVAEELEELQKRGDELEAQIRDSIITKQSVQWFSSLSLIFLTIISVGFSFYTVPDRSRRTVYSVLSVFTGFLLLYCFRRLANEYFNWSIQRKLNAREEVVKKKRDLLEKVKETETFKVAKEILDKYDDTPYEPEPQPQKSRLSIAPNQPSASPNASFAGPPTVKEKLLEKPDEAAKENVAAREDGAATETTLRSEPPLMPVMPPKPPRPFFKAQRTVAEKVVDFIIGDAPTDRFALICSFCYGHNGMARKEEFDFISYRCWLCGEFNPARRQRQAMQLKQTRSDENITGTSNAGAGSVEDPEMNLKQRRNRVKPRSGSHQRPLLTEATPSNDTEESSDAGIGE